MLLMWYCNSEVRYTGTSTTTGVPVLIGFATYHTPACDAGTPATPSPVSLLAHPLFPDHPARPFSHQPASPHPAPACLPPPPTILPAPSPTILPAPAPTILPAHLDHPAALLQVHQHVGTLDVPVPHLVGMQVPQRLQQLPQHTAHLHTAHHMT